MSSLLLIGVDLGQPKYSLIGGRQNVGMHWRRARKSKETLEHLRKAKENISRKQRNGQSKATRLKIIRGDHPEGNRELEYRIPRLHSPVNSRKLPETFGDSCKKNKPAADFRGGTLSEGAARSPGLRSRPK